MISVVLVEPETPGNIGAVSRVMANLGFDRLIIINPKCDVFSEEAVCRAKHSQSILKKAKIVNKDYLKKFDYLIGSTSKISNDYNIPRAALRPSEFAKEICKSDRKIALIFGREGIGLTNEEVQMCDSIVSIPTDRKYPALNLSHSVGILLYEISKSRNSKDIFSEIEYASGKDKEVLEKQILKKLEGMKFTTEEKKETQKKVWKRIIGKSFLTKREAFALIGFFKKLQNKR